MEGLVGVSELGGVKAVDRAIHQEGIDLFANLPAELVEACVVPLIQREGKSRAQELRNAQPLRELNKLIAVMRLFFPQDGQHVCDQAADERGDEREQDLGFHDGVVR